MFNLCHYPDACILLVEDDEQQLNLLRAILKRAGYTDIHVCSDAKKAAAEYWRLIPDIMLLDQNMPGRSGIEVLTEITKEKSGEYFPIIMITADADSKTKLKALSLGSKDFINKPYDKLDVLARLNTIIDSKRMHQQLKLENNKLGITISETSTDLQSEKQEKMYAQSKLAHNLLHDDLTGLENKKLFLSKMSEGIKRDELNSKYSSVILIHIGNIKLINNSLGHKYGDALLKQIAASLSDITLMVCKKYKLNYEDLHLAHFSGNNFVIGLSNLESNKIATQLCEQCVENLAESFQLNKMNIELKYFVGLVHYPEHGESLELLLQRADIAAFQAEEEKKNFCVYDAKFGEYAKYKVTLMQDLKLAMRNDVLELYLQPKVDLRNWKIYGFEALLRWNHPEHGFIPPDQFVAIAEETGIINQLSCWVLNRGLEIQAKLKKLGYTHNIAVNITASDLLNRKFIRYICERLSSSDYTPNSLTLELTETTMIQDPEEVLKNIKLLEKYKVCISIDDFGTGYSSLAYLKKISAQELKIDKSFVMDIASNQENQVIVRTIINLAHYLNMQVVAEGVEDILSFELLNEYACDCIQGFWISRPIPFDELLPFIDSFDMVEKKASCG